MPTGTPAPKQAPQSEINLDAFFAAQGEAIDWIADAHDVPDRFSPLCDFTAAFMLKESGSTDIGVGFYNVVPGATVAPTPAEIFEIIPAGTPVGTVITGQSIRGNVNFAGGEIGFALIRPALGDVPHYSETKWNTVCTGGACAATPGPWILAVKYQSVSMANTFYLAFEDGDAGAWTWSNDGDYNDYVFRFTGLACAGAGETCDVQNALGVCKSGLTECDDTGVLVCKQLVSASAEACDGVDNDCNGDIDEGDAVCSAGERCVRGTCVPLCGDEFPCFGEDVCEEGLCVNPECVGKTCDEGQACIDGSCQAPCDGVVCPGDQVCRVGRCVDACAGVSCSDTKVCSGGVCVLPCSCTGCAAGLACAGDGRCVEQGCETQSCGVGDVCRAAECVPACTGAVCPRGTECSDGECVTPSDDDAGVPTTGGSGQGGVGASAAGTYGEGAIGSAAGAGGTGGRDRRNNGDDAGGCGCSVPGQRTTPSPSVGLGVLGMLGLLLRKRRRRS